VAAPARSAASEEPRDTDVDGSTKLFRLAALDPERVSRFSATTDSGNGDATVAWTPVLCPDAIAGAVRVAVRISGAVLAAGADSVDDGAAGVTASGPGLAAASAVGASDTEAVAAGCTEPVPPAVAAPETVSTAAGDGVATGDEGSKVSGST
jgi:hypothetical protein